MKNENGVCVGGCVVSQGRYALAVWLSDTYYFVLEHEVRTSYFVLGKINEWIVIRVNVKNEL